MPQFIYTMKGLGKVHPPDIKVLDDIWLSFYFGAKIGVLGLNGAGKSSLLKIMAGEDTSFIGEAFPAEGISIGFLHQEPRLDPRKDVRGNVEEGVAPIKALLTRYDDVNARLGEDLSPEDMEKVLDEQGRLQDKIDASNAWDLDSRLELAMDALRLRQAKGKARLNAYEDLLRQDTAQKIETAEIYIAPGPRLGDTVVEARGLKKGYGDKLLIENLDFTLPPGGIVGVIGPNGAGKTTLFRMITGQEKPDEGTLKIGETVQIGYVDQSPAALAL